MVLKIQFVKLGPMGTHEDDEKVRYFSSGYMVMNRSTVILEELVVMDGNTGEKIAKWTSEKSGCTLKRIDRLSLNTDKYSPLTGSQYLRQEGRDQVEEQKLGVFQVDNPLRPITRRSNALTG